MRTLCLDYGEKRIGIAVSDPMGWTAQALDFIYNDHKLLTKIQELISEYEVETILIGLPLNMKGQDTKKTLETRQFKAELEQKLPLQIKFWDERLSTVAATKHLIAADVSRKKRKSIVDSQAAAFLLQGYLNSIKNNI